MPQTDENRTYYNMKITFNEDVEYENFARDFDLFYFDGRFVRFEKIYLSRLLSKSKTKRLIKVY